MKALITVGMIGLTASISACSAPDRTGSESVYSTSEVGVAKKITRCRVLESREVTLKDEDPHGTGTLIGVIAGAIIGEALGDRIGEGAGRELAQDLGALGGAVAGATIGEQVDKDRSTRPGVEYSVILADSSELTIVQELLDGDRLIAAGDSCRLQSSNGDGYYAYQTGQSYRVLPAEQLPMSVVAPKVSTVQ